MICECVKNIYIEEDDILLGMKSQQERYRIYKDQKKWQISFFKLVWLELSDLIFANLHPNLIFHWKYLLVNIPSQIYWIIILLGDIKTRTTEHNTHGTFYSNLHLLWTVQYETGFYTWKQIVGQIFWGLLQYYWSRVTLLGNFEQ